MAGSDVFSTHVLSSEIAAADPDGVCTTQSTSGAANLTIDGALTDGGVATLIPARNATITSAGSSETGKTFTGNSSLKANYFSEFVNYPVISDDSGLCIKSLKNKPGI